MKLKFAAGDDRMLLCPMCDHDATHVEGVCVAARGEDREINEITVDAVTGRVTTHEETPAPMGSLREGRRHRIALTGECEQGHSFAIVFTQHKGGTFVEVVPDEPGNPTSR